MSTEKKGIFAKIAKAVLVGGGTVLSLFAPAIGAPLVVAGQNINTKGSNDKMAAYATNFQTAKTQVTGMTAGGRVASMWDKIMINPLPYVAGLAGVWVLLKMLKIIK